MSSANITPEMVQALRDIIRHKIAMWDASTLLESLCETDIDTGGDVIEGLAVGVDDISMIDEDDVRDVLEGDGREWGPIEQVEGSDDADENAE